MEEQVKEVAEPVLDTDTAYKHTIVWPNVMGYLAIHLIAIYGVYHFILYGNWLTFAWAYFCGFASEQGITLGAHRLFSHRTFKAHYSVRLAVIILQTVAGQNSMYTWVRDHRVHHRYSDTDADLHNSRRGFFFSHMGWLLMKKHPDVKVKGKTVDLSDIEADPLVMMQKKYFFPMYIVFSIGIPVAVPMYLWHETFVTSFCLAYMFRYVCTLHTTWLINSAAHMYGTRPYDKNILPVENALLAIITYGEGWHNYHHIFPSDYRASELGVNITTTIIDMLARLGVVYDMRSIPEHLVKQRMNKTGDGSKTAWT